MKNNFTNFYHKTFRNLLAFCMVLWMSINVFAQTTATEDFEDEGPVPQSAPFKKSNVQSGINFTMTGRLKVTGLPTSVVGANGSHYFMDSNDGLLSGTVTGNIGSFAINNTLNPSTAFKINSFAGYVASDILGNNTTSGNITFIGTKVDNTTVSATINIPNNPSVQNGITFTGTALDGIYLTSVAISLPSGIQYIEIDDINFTTQAVVTNQFSINDVSQLEGNSGTSTFQFTVTRTSNSAAGSVSVVSANGTASAGSDYVAFPLTVVSFTAGGALTQTVSVMVNGDATIEPDETFTMTLSSPTGGVLLDATGTGTILDDDASVETFETETDLATTFSEATVNFQSSGKFKVNTAPGLGATNSNKYLASTTPFATGNQGTITVTSVGKSINMLSVDLWTANVVGATYTPTASTVTFTGTKADGTGTVSHTANITPTNPSGSGHIRVSFAGTPFANVPIIAIAFNISSSVNYLQVDNIIFSPQVVSATQLSINDVSILEGTGSGTTPAIFTVTRSNNTTAFSVDVASSNGTATAGTDYTAVPTTTLNFTNGGALTQTITVLINKDATNEPNETFNMTLSNATNGTTYLKQVGVGTINNDDGGIGETFEDETALATTFTENSVTFSASGGYQVKNTSNAGSGSSANFLTSLNNVVGSMGTITITSPNKAFKIISLDAWVGTSTTAFSSGSVTFTGTVFGGGSDVVSNQTITATNNTGTGWQQNVTFTGSILGNAILTSLKVTTGGTLKACDIDNFNFLVVDTSPIINVVDASNNAITNGGAAATGNNTDFGGACVSAGTVSKTYTIKNTGLTNLTLSGSPLAVLGGADAGQFSITTQPTTPISATTGTTTFTVQFDPSSAGVKNATITLTNNDGSNSPYIINIKGTGNANPTITTSASTAICAGATSFTIPYTATTGTPTTYSISGAGITTVTDGALTATPITVNLSPGASGTSISYTLTVKNVNGCVSSNVVGSVVVNPLPTIAVGTILSICAGATSFTMPYTGTTGTPTTYSISGTGITTVTNATLPASPITVSLSSGATGTSISFTLTVKNAAGCTSSNVLGSVPVNPLPTLTKSASTAICTGATSFTIPYTATTGTPTTYSISGAGITAVTDVALPATPITVNLSSGASGSSISYTLTVKNANGCTSSNIAGSVSVNPKPTITTSASPAICAGATSFTIPYTATTGTPTTYSIFGVNITAVSFGTLTTSPITVNLSAGASGTSFNYTLSVENANGCASSSVTNFVTVNSTPAPTSPTATPSNITVSGNTTTLTASGCGSPSTITWYDAANPTVALPNNTPAITATKTFFAKCTGTNTCVSDASPSVTVTYNPCVPLGASPGPVSIAWTGLVSTDWSNACNWNPAWVPNATNSEVVIDLQTNQPVITGTVPTIPILYMNENATLTVNSGGALTITGSPTSIRMQGANSSIINDGTINVGSGTTLGINVFVNASITNRGTITTNNGFGVQCQGGTLTFTNESTGVITGNISSAGTGIFNLTNHGTINNFGVGFFMVFISGSSLINDGTINITSGQGISNPSGSNINNNACGKILMSAGTYTNGGTTTNAGLIQLPNTYNFTNTGTFTNNGVLKANTVSSITNNEMVITNACPIFTLGAGEKYSVSGIFTNNAATTSAGTYTKSINKFTADNTLPAGTQTLYARVTNTPTEGMCTFIVPFDFNNRKPTAVSVNRTTICTGGSVTLSATCTSGTTLTWYTTATGGTSIGTGTSLTNSPSVATTYYVACESVNCVSGRVATNGVSVSSAPSASASSNSPVCVGTTLNLNSGSEGNTYMWAGPNSFTSTELSPSIPNVTSLATGTYTITVTNASSCSSTATTAVIINALPVATASSSTPSICVGNTISLTGGGVGSYFWTGPNGFSSISQSPTISNATVSATGTYTITVTNTSNCSSTATVAVTVNALPTATASSSTPVVICAGNSISLTGGGGGTYLWTGPNTYTSSAQSPTIINATVSATGTYTITVTNASNCTSTATVAVTVNSNPTATASSSTPSVCVGNTISLTGGGVGTYVWAGPNGYSSISQSPTIANATVSATGTYTITVTNVSNCTSTATVAVTVNPLPLATISYASSPFCKTVTAGTVTLTGTTGGTYSSTAGLTINATTGEINPSTSTAGTYTVTYTIAASGGCAIVTATSSVTITNLPTATISYASSSFCKTAIAGTVTLTGTTGGTYSSTAGLTINSSTGEINPSTSTAGSYTVTYTIAASGGCAIVTATASVTITTLPTANISYAGTPFCRVGADGAVTLTGTTGGTYSSSPSGLTINTTTGVINPRSSFEDTYTVTYTIPASGGCAVVTATTSVRVNTPAGGTINYAGAPFCKTVISGTVTQTGTTGGTFSSTAGLTINATTGEINPSTSTAGSYTVTYTIAPTGGCPEVSFATNVTITTLPTASISYAATPFCKTATAGTVTLTGTTGGTYSSTAGLTINSSTGEINPSTSTAGTYTVTYTIPASGGCAIVTATTSVTITTLPTANISYASSPFCKTATAGIVTLTGTTGGIFSSTAGLFINSSTGEINPSASTAGTYTVTYTIAASGGCGIVTATTSVTITTLSTATIFYLGTSFCKTSTSQLVSGTGTTGGTFSSTAGLTINATTGEINPSTSTAGTYTVTYTIAASGGCAIVTATTSVTINDLSIPNPSSDAPKCVGTTLTFNSVAGMQTYTWTGPNSFTGNTQNPSISNVTTAANGAYLLTVTNTNGCTASATTSVTIYALPTATASSNSPICSGTTLNLSASGGTSYAWTGVSGYSSTDQNPSIANANISATGKYQVIVTNGNNCTAMATTSVTVNPTPATPTTQADTQIIFGANIILTATGCSGVNNVLKWYQTADNVLVAMPVSPTVITSYYAKCEITTNGITCISGNSNNVTVTVLSPNPPVATAATNCLGTPTTLTATGCSGSVGTFVLKWYQNSNDALVTMPVSPLVTTDYYAKCEQTSNSVTATSAKSNVVTLTILNPPTPVSTGGTIYNGQSISLTATGCTGTLGTFTLKWYQTADNVLVTMPVSPTVTTQYYAKCEQTANSITCLSPKSNDVSVTVVNRIFVDITKVVAPIQNGNSWATAYGNLQTGLAAATAGVEVWVAKGTYKPTNTTDRNITFSIPNNVIVYGGFFGTEDNLIDRNFRTNISILNGEIGDLNTILDNIRHVVTFNGSSTSTVLDGFTITGGNANFDPKNTVFSPSLSSASSTELLSRGGGITVDNGGSPVITNCIFNRNHAVTGGGLFAGDNSKPTITACKFMGNLASFGAGMYFQDGSHAKVENTLISGNRSIGAIYNNYANPIITNCTFGGNGGYNGGIFNSNSQPVMKNSIVWGNSTPFNDTQTTITYSTIQGGYSGEGNLSIDPKYVSQMPEGLAPNITGDYHLQVSSLAIDRGDNGIITLTDKDLDGNLRRFANGRVDMGTYEFQGAATATLIISVASGSWETNSTWDIGRIPQLGDYVIIDNSHIVTLTGTGVAKNLEYRGTGKLKFNATTSKLEIGF